MSSLIVLKSQSQESFGGGWRTSEWGKGEKRPAGEERTKGEIQERGREPEDPRGLGVCAGESRTPGAREQTGQGHTLQRGAPWTGLGAGAAHTPLEDGGRKERVASAGSVPLR